MINYKEIFKLKPFSLEQRKKNSWYFRNQKKLTLYHYNCCKEYANLSDKIFGNIKDVKCLEELPFVPVNLFKFFQLKSNGKNDFSKTLISSGTSGLKKSQIFLDKKTSLLQSRALSIIYSDILKKKLKIFFVDTPEVLNQKNIFSARIAAIKGFYQFVKEPEFILDKKLNLDFNKVLKFIKENVENEFIIFGFTSLIWNQLICNIKKHKIKVPNNKGIVIHGGGWKKLKDKSVSRNLFNSTVKKNIGIERVHNYYGMVEQTGSIFLECEKGFFHTSIFSEVLIRNKDMNICSYKQEGLIQVFSLLPISYPGHNILTEDVGILEGEDDCKCGRKGKYFSIIGRIPDTELRGCSDVN